MMEIMTNWRQLINKCANGDEIIHCTLSDEELNKPFDNFYGSIKGMPFTAWSKKYVYFPVCFEGSEWVGRAPRNICDEATSHHGVC